MNAFIFIAQQTLYFAIPLLIVALGGMFSEKSGIVNIALEGIMVVGAFFGVLFLNKTQGSLSGQVQLLLAILIAGLSGMAFSFFHAFASIYMKADQVISGTALNLFAPAFAAFLARSILGTQQIPFQNTFRIPTVPILGQIPVLGNLLFRNAYITTYLGIFILAVSFIIVFKTKFGLRLRACGEHPQAAESVGVKVQKTRLKGVLLSGALAGIGGIAYIIPTSTNFNATVSGYGFLALAVLIFGNWNPVRILWASLFFGLMKAVASSYSGIPFLVQLRIPSYIYKMAPFIATLLVLAFMKKISRAPQALGVPYDKGSR